MKDQHNDKAEKRYDAMSWKEIQALSPAEKEEMMAIGEASLEADVAELHRQGINNIGRKVDSDGNDLGAPGVLERPGFDEDGNDLGAPGEWSGVPKAGFDEDGNDLGAPGN